MSLRFEGERLTPDILSPSLRDQLRFVRDWGITFPFGMLYAKADHLSRYEFAAKEYVFQGKRTLDIGCGIGYGADILKASGAELVIGGDIDFASMKYAQETYGREGLSYLPADAENLPFSPDSFDMVVCLEVIEHLKKPEKFLGAVSKILTEDGIFIVSTPNREVTNPGASLEDNPKNEHHEREYLIEEFEKLLEEYFNHVEFFTQFNPQIVRTGNPVIRRLKLLANLGRLEELLRVVPFEESQKLTGIIAVCRR